MPRSGTMIFDRVEGWNITTKARAVAKEIPAAGVRNQRNFRFFCFRAITTSSCSLSELRHAMLTGSSSRDWTTSRIAICRALFSLTSSTSLFSGFILLFIILCTGSHISFQNFLEVGASQKESALNCPNRHFQHLGYLLV